jgi:hypothetical protein
MAQKNRTDIIAVGQRALDLFVQDQTIRLHKVTNDPNVLDVDVTPAEATALVAKDPSLVYATRSVTIVLHNRR